MWQAVKHGGRKEYDAVQSVIAKPKTPQIGIAAMRALGATDDEALRGAFPPPLPFDFGRFGNEAHVVDV